MPAKPPALSGIGCGEGVGAAGSLGLTHTNCADPKDGDVTPDSWTELQSINLGTSRGGNHPAEAKLLGDF